MGKPSRATQEKRKRELSKRERHQVKTEQRAQRKEERAVRDAKVQSGVDPDLEGIVAGPQPQAEL